MKRYLAVIASFVMVLLPGVSWCSGADGKAADKADKSGVAGDSQGTVILDSYGFWRVYHQLRPPMMQTAGGLKPTDLAERRDAAIASGLGEA